MANPQKCPYDRDARQKAHERSQSGDLHVVGTKENDLKPASAAGLSKLANQAIRLSTEQVPATTRRILGDSWRGLRLDLLKQLDDAIKVVAEDPSNKETVAQLTDLQIRRRKDTAHAWANPIKSLARGAQTGYASTTAIVRDMHTKTEPWHDDPAYTALLAHSYKPSFEITSGNETQVEAFLGDVFPNNRLPEVIHTGLAFGYATSVMDIPVTRATQKAILFSSPPQPAAQTIGDLEPKYGPAVGCPIMLNPEDVVTILQHTVAAASERGLLA